MRESAPAHALDPPARAGDTRRFGVGWPRSRVTGRAARRSSSSCSSTAARSRRAARSRTSSRARSRQPASWRPRAESRRGRRLRGPAARRPRPHLRPRPWPSPAKVAQIRAYGAELRDRRRALCRRARGERGVGDADRAHSPSTPTNSSRPCSARARWRSSSSAQAPDLDTLLVAVGGGGLIGGIAAWYARPHRLVGVEPGAAPTLTRALAAGRASRRGGRRRGGRFARASAGRPPDVPVRAALRRAGSARDRRRDRRSAGRTAGTPSGSPANRGRGGAGRAPVGRIPTRAWRAGRRPGLRREHGVVSVTASDRRRLPAYADERTRRRTQRALHRAGPRQAIPGRARARCHRRRALDRHARRHRDHRARPPARRDAAPTSPSGFATGSLHILAWTRATTFISAAASAHAVCSPMLPGLRTEPILASCHRGGRHAIRDPAGHAAARRMHGRQRAGRPQPRAAGRPAGVRGTEPPESAAATSSPPTTHGTATSAAIRSIRPPMR